MPSGIWAAEEYEKLPHYDNDTAFQPVGAFFCHQQDGRLCAGWVGCHDMQESLGLRLAASLGTLDGSDVEAALDYVSSVPLWESGAAAAAHGMAGIEHPDADAQRVASRLHKRRRRTPKQERRPQ